MNAEQIAMAMCAHFEGNHLKAYKCPAGFWTVGIGHMIKMPKESDLMKGITEAQSAALFSKDIAGSVAAVRSLVNVPLNENQRAALIDFVFNAGSGALATSTLLKKLNARDYLGASSEFLRWDHASGKVLAGLTRRCKVRRAIFLGATVADMQRQRWLM